MIASSKKLIFAAVPLLLTAVACTDMGMRGKGKLSVEREIVVNHSPEKVWKKLGGFFAMNEWHPAVADVLVREGGMVRVLVLGDGAEVHERLLKYKDGKSYKYSIFESPWPIRDYVSKIRVEPSGDGAKVTWSSTFNADDAKAMTDLFTTVYDAGLQNLEKVM